MQKDIKVTRTTKKKLVLRKESIRELDNADLSLVTGGWQETQTAPTPGGSPPGSGVA